MRQYEGCKVRLSRPTILLAGVGLEDDTDAEHESHWNSLVEADRALNLLPDNPSESDLDAWGWRWGQTLLRHYSLLKPPSKPQIMAELLLLTKISGKPYYRRTDVDWDGTRLTVSRGGQQIDQSRPYLEYSGVCRDFVTHSSFEGGSLVKGKYVNPVEKHAMDVIGRRVKKEGTSTEDLVYAAENLEEWLVRVDERVEGPHATIAPPFATAEWPEGSSQWKVHLNPACGQEQSKLQVTSNLR